MTVLGTVRLFRNPAAHPAVLGHEPHHVGENPWTDSALLAAVGIETVVFGPVGTGAHAAEEWIDLESVVQTARVLVYIALSYCAAE